MRFAILYPQKYAKILALAILKHTKSLQNFFISSLEYPDSSVIVLPLRCRYYTISLNLFADSNTPLKSEIRSSIYHSDSIVSK